MKRALLRSAIAASLLISCQQSLELPESEPIETNDRFTRVAIASGLPDFAPLTRKNLGDPRSASIPLQAADQILSFTIGQGPEGPEYWLLHRHGNQSASLTSINMSDKGDGRLEGLANLPVDPSSLDIKPLTLRLTDKPPSLEYRLDAVVHSGIQVGLSAPEIILQSLSGAESPLTSFRGTTVVVNYWAPTCVPCVEEMPQLNRLAERYASESIYFIAIAMGTASEVAQFLANRQFSYEHYLATDQSITTLGQALPRNFVLDSDGIVIYDRTGYGANTPAELAGALTIALK